MFFKKRFNFLVMMIIFTLAVFILSGCEQSQIKGVKEKGKLEEEPTIKVKLSDGKEKQLKLEEYITGVVAGEMKANWPKNAYGAQAILARTFALKYLEENNTDVISGSYEYAQEYKPENISDTIRKAVETTRGQVVLYKDEYIKGWFHSSAGGKTTSAKVGLAFAEDEPPYIKSVDSPDEMAPADIKNWQVSFTAEEIQSALNKMGKNVGQIEDIKIIDRDDTGRVIEFEFIGSKNNEEVKAANFRKELDPEKLKSTKISNLEKKENNYIFSGSGFGHGVGMSQWGAFSLAKENKSSSEIVEHYFDNIEVVKIYE